MIRPHIVRGYFCGGKYHTQHLAGEREKPGSETRETGQRQETRGFLCYTMFICFYSQFGSSRLFFKETGGGVCWGECDLECVQTPGLSPRPLLPRPAGLSGYERADQITAKTQRLRNWRRERARDTDRQTDRQTDRVTDRQTNQPGHNVCVRVCCRDSR